jgi:hypothetical protein
LTAQYVLVMVDLVALVSLAYSPASTRRVTRFAL